MNCAKRFGVLVTLVVVFVPACSRQQAPNANKDIQKQQKNLMDAMDRIAAEEEKKRPPGEPMKEAAPPSPAPSQEQSKPAETKPVEPGKP